MGSSLFSLEDLLSRIGEAESLQAQLVELLNSDDKPLRNAFALRWAIVADEVTQLIIFAEEQLSQDQIAQLKQVVHNYYPGCWETYQENSGRLARLSDNGDMSK